MITTKFLSIQSWEEATNYGCHLGLLGYFVLKDGYRYLLTANHLWGGCSDTDGTQVYQNGTYLGEIAGHHQAHDWSIIEDTSSALNFSRDPWIWGGDTARQLASYVTRDGLHHFKSEGTTVYKQGISTAETLGQIIGVAVDRSDRLDECASIANVIETNCDTAGGDSGGPMYIYEGDGQVSIMGHTLYTRDPWPHGPVGTACNGQDIMESQGGYPAWRITKKIMVVSILYIHGIYDIQLVLRYKDKRGISVDIENDLFLRCGVYIT